MTANGVPSCGNLRKKTTAPHSGAEFADLCLTTWLRRQRVKSHQNTQVSQPRRASIPMRVTIRSSPSWGKGFRNKWDFASKAVFWTQDENHFYATDGRLLAYPTIGIRYLF